MCLFIQVISSGWGFEVGGGWVGSAELQFNVLLAQIQDILSIFTTISDTLIPLGICILPDSLITGY